MERKDTIIRILLIAVFILFCGEAYLFSALKAAQGVVTQAASQATAQAVPAAQNPSAATSVEVPADVLKPVGGQIASISSNAFEVSQGNASSTITIDLSANTLIVKEGAPKSAAQYAADMQSFHAYTEQLLQDPQANQQALENLIAPSQDAETTVPFSSLAQGTRVTVLGDAQGDGSIVAVKIIVGQ